MGYASMFEDIVTRLELASHHLDKSISTTSRGRTFQTMHNEARQMLSEAKRLCSRTRELIRLIPKEAGPRASRILNLEHENKTLKEQAAVLIKALQEREKLIARGRMADIGIIESTTRGRHPGLIRRPQATFEYLREPGTPPLRKGDRVVFYAESADRSPRRARVRKLRR